MRQKIRIVTLTVATIGALATFIACGSSLNGSPVTPAPGVSAPVPGDGGPPVAVKIVGSSFSPNPLTVSAGEHVVWTNSDGVAHTATADDGSFDTGAIAPGATSATVVMNAEGTITLHCKLHPGEVATIIVQ